MKHALAEILQWILLLAGLALGLLAFDHSFDALVEEINRKPPELSR